MIGIRNKFQIIIKKIKEEKKIVDFFFFLKKTFLPYFLTVIFAFLLNAL